MKRLRHESRPEVNSVQRYAWPSEPNATSDQRRDPRDEGRGMDCKQFSKYRNRSQNTEGCFMKRKTLFRRHWGRVFLAVLATVILWAPVRAGNPAVTGYVNGRGQGAESSFIMRASLGQ
jgi:hypothetical protein